MSVQPRARRLKPAGFHQASSRAFELVAILALGTVVVAVAVPMWLLFDNNSASGHQVNRLVLACQEGVRRGSLATVGFAAAALALAWGLSALAVLLWRTVRDLRNMHRFESVLQSATFGSMAPSGPMRDVMVLADRVAFTAGLIRPRVYIGGDLIADLSADELDAVLLHERRHQQSRDPLRCWLIGLILGAIFWRPMTSVCAYYRASREVAADRAVVDAQGDDQPLLRALTVADRCETTSGVCGLSAERESALSDLRHLEARLPRLRAGLLFFGLMAMLGLIVVAVVGLSDWQGYWFCPYGTPMFS